MTRLTVVIAARNSAATIGTTLESLTAQQWDQPWEVVVADNGSTDETRDVVARYADQLPAVRVVDASGPCSPGHARNAGAQAARGELLVFVDSDDAVEHGFVAAMGNALAQNEAVIARLRFDKLNPAWARATRDYHQTTEPLSWWLASYLPFAYGGTIGIRRRLHEAIGGFDTELVPAGEDVDYCWRLGQAGVTLAFVPEAVVQYRLRTRLPDLYRQARGYGESWAYLYRKHRPRGLPSVDHRVRRSLVAWARSFRHAVLAFRRERAARLAWDVGWRVGTLRGWIKHGVLLP
jgi:glycosyltransferase involved in cell wall biosynthesis